MDLLPTTVCQTNRMKRMGWEHFTLERNVGNLAPSRASRCASYRRVCRIKNPGIHNLPKKVGEEITLSFVPDRTTETKQMSSFHLSTKPLALPQGVSTVPLPTLGRRQSASSAEIRINRSP